MHLREPGTREPRPCAPNIERSDASAGPPDLRCQGRPSPPVVTGTYGSRTRQPDLCQCQVSVIRAHHHAFGRAGAGLNSRDPEPSPPTQLWLLGSVGRRSDGAKEAQVPSSCRAQEQNSKDLAKYKASSLHKLYFYPLNSPIDRKNRTPAPAQDDEMTR